MSSTDATPSLGRTRATAAAVVIGSLIVGALLGVAGDRLFLMHHGGRMAARGGRFLMSRYTERLDRELRLTPQQHERVTAILNQSHARIQQLSQGIRPQMRREIQSANDGIDAILTPEQRTKFRTMRMSFESNHRDRH